MSDSPIFELRCEQIEGAARLSRLESRGTVRLMLKEVGLDPKHLSKGAAMVTVDRFLEKALRVRRVASPEQVKDLILQALRESKLADSDGEDPEAIFGRITLRR